MTEHEELIQGMVKAGDKLDKVACILGNDLATPMADTLKEIRASSRTRWIVLVAMFAVLGIFIYISFDTVSRFRDMQQRHARQFRNMQRQNMVQQVRLTELINMAEKSARPENKMKLQRLQKMATPESVKADAVQDELDED